MNFVSSFKNRTYFHTYSIFGMCFNECLMHFKKCFQSVHEYVTISTRLTMVELEAEARYIRSSQLLLFPLVVAVVDMVVDREVGTDMAVVEVGMEVVVVDMVGVVEVEVGKVVAVVVDMVVVEEEVGVVVGVVEEEVVEVEGDMVVGMVVVEVDMVVVGKVVAVVDKVAVVVGMVVVVVVGVDMEVGMVVGKVVGNPLFLQGLLQLMMMLSHLYLLSAKREINLKPFRN